MLSLPTQTVFCLLVGYDIMGDRDIAKRPRCLFDLDVLVLVDLRRVWVILVDRRPSPLRFFLLRAGTGLPLCVSLPMPIGQPTTNCISRTNHSTAPRMQSFQPLSLHPSRLLSIRSLRARTHPTMPLLWNLSGVHDVETGSMTPSGAVVACDGEAVVV